MRLTEWELIMDKKLKCGLIGKPLGHSYSPQIHFELGSYEYSLFELEEKEVGDFVKSDAYDAINVTIPYKKTVMEFLDEISPEALRIGSVNTVTRGENGRLIGNNTDYYGFSYLIDRAGINLSGKKVLILGSGGASMTARTVAADRAAWEIVIISRSGRDNYENIRRHADCDVLINTTPVGMYPNNGTSPVSLDAFPRLCGVVDMIYNPERTALILEAEKRGIRCTSGLPMLVAQAKAASEFFTGEKIPESETERIIAKISARMKNITLVGMPGSGKSTIAKKLSEMLSRPFFDSDALIEEKAGTTIPEIFKKYGEARFRELEHEVIGEITKKQSSVIATGGGAVLSNENRDLIRQNSFVVFLQRDISSLPREGRPISLSADLEDLYKLRFPYYNAVADISVKVDDDVQKNAEKIISLLGL